MGKERIPVTPAIRVLRAAKVPYTEYIYKYVEHGGTTASSRELKVDEHCMVKTLVMEDENKKPLIVLMHGDRQVSTKELARQIGAKTVSPCLPETAEKHTGYKVGGTSPFGTRKTLPVYMEATVAEAPKVFINGGRRGYLVELNPYDLIRLLKPTVVTVGITTPVKQKRREEGSQGDID
ncbi:MAG: Cys-tRNA(Pro) deacylase [Deltaproteobacteria bacterium]|nr:Cys-tRNA(Pro) deacylase [Deltaproteobacteria bacterium]